MNEPTPAPVYPAPPPVPAETRPDGHVVGMIAFFVSEAAFFSTLLVTYVIYLGTNTSGPTPREALSLSLVIGTTLCLLSSSVTIHLAEKALHAGAMAAFKGWWSLTIVLGALFLFGTGYEWYGLINDHGLTISRNMFGSTFYTVVGFHGAHVTVGMLMLVLMLALAWRGLLAPRHSKGIKLVAWYWHFVDVVWVVVFLVIYVFGR
jgi:cytochrome c oxidase subunit 3/cytochrome o ubiquinol oxidase subunit 3